MQPFSHHKTENLQNYITEICFTTLDTKTGLSTLHVKDRLTKKFYTICIMQSLRQFQVKNLITKSSVQAAKVMRRAESQRKLVIETINTMLNCRLVCSHLGVMVFNASLQNKTDVSIVIGLLWKPPFTRVDSIQQTYHLKNWHQGKWVSLILNVCLKRYIREGKIRGSLE